MVDPKPSRPRVSLTWWILALAVVPMLGALGLALLALSRHPENESDRVAATALLRVAPAVDQALDTQAEQLARLGAVIARDPKFYAVLTLPSASKGGLEFREALEGVLRDFQREADASVFAVTGPSGALLGRALAPPTGAVDLSRAPFVLTAIAGTQGTGFLVERGRIHRVATVPISAGGVLVGTLTLGRPVDAELSGRLKTAMEADLTLVVERSIAASTLVPSPLRKSLSERLSERTLGAAGGVPVVTAGGRRYLAVRRVIEGHVVGGGSLEYILTRPLGSDASPLVRLERDLLRAGGLGLSLALVCGAIVALAVRRERLHRARAHEAEREAWTERERGRNGLLSGVAKRVLDPAETVYTITDLVADGALGELSAPQREGILAIRRASRGLARLAQDLSTMASLERGDVPLSHAPVEIGNLVERAATLVIPVASERRQMIEISVEPDLVHPRLDENLLARALEGVALQVVEDAPDATKIALGAKRAGQGIEITIVGAEREARANRDSGEEDLAPCLARLLTSKHDGTLELVTREGSGYRIWLPLPSPAPTGSGLSDISSVGSPPGSPGDPAPAESPDTSEAA
jgi:signal transduction histidine kinase